MSLIEKQKMKKIKLKNQPKWVARCFILAGAVLGGLFAFVSHPIGMANAQSAGCPDGQRLATGDVCITNDLDIVIQATATEANQTLTINKYFANAYTVDRGDGNPVENLAAHTTHTYENAGIYNIILSLTGGASRWKFTNSGKPLVPSSGSNVTGVKITYMPSLAEGFGNSATNPGNYFFARFNYNGKLTSLPENSFDTSNISGTVGNYFFGSFNRSGALTSLPENSFDTSNITTVGNAFFQHFNNNGVLTSLPENSFDTSNITTVGSDFFQSFNANGALTSLPENSFDTSNITTVGSDFFQSFNQNGALTSLPENSFDTSNITKAGSDFFQSFNQNGALTNLPENSFDTSNITKVGAYFFQSFNQNGALTNLPENSFDTSNITTVVYAFFQSFNANGALTNLPANSFDISNITKAGDYFFNSFNQNGALTNLPANSFDTSNIIEVKDCFFCSFNQNGALTNLPANSFRLSTGLMITGNNFFLSFNSNGKLTSLPENSFDTSSINGTVGSSFFSSFNHNGALTNLPEGSFDTSNITTVGNGFFQNFNYNGALTSLPENSFDTSNITTVGTAFFQYFNYNGKLTSLPDSFKLTSAAYNKSNSYQNAFNSSNYTLNRNVSDLVSGVTAPSSDRNTFSDNQPGRCGVNPNWLVSTADACSITYNSNGGSTISSPTKKYTADTTSVVAGNGVTTPTRANYAFDGWYTDPDGGELVETITFPDMDENILYAHWKEKEQEYAITFNTSADNLRDENGDIPDSNTITYTKSDEIVLYTNVKQGYNFNGWDVDTENSSGTWLNITDTITDMNIGSGHTGNVLLTYNSTPLTYELSIDDSDCDISANTFTVIYNKSLNAPGTTLSGENSLPIPTKTGYTFKGYSRDYGSTTLLLKFKSGKVSPNILFNDGNFDIDHDNLTSTIYPVFDVKNITIVLHDPVGGNSNIPNNTYGSSVVLPDLDSDVYIFDGWYSAESGGNLLGEGGQEYLIDTDTTPIHMYARWSCPPGSSMDEGGNCENVATTLEYKLYIDDSDCTVSPNVLDVIYGKVLNATGTTLEGLDSLPIPTKADHRFKGYSKEPNSTELILRYKNGKIATSLHFNDSNFVVDHDSKSATIYPVFEFDGVTVYYHDSANGDSSVLSTSGGVVVLPTPQAAGSIFQGWYDEDGNLFGNGGDEYTISTNGDSIHMYVKRSCVDGYFMNNGVCYRNYIHYKAVDGVGTITVCDPASNGEKCITIQDKNLGASKSGTICSSADTGACGYHYQWGNNYGFANPGVNGSDSITELAISGTINTEGYGPQNYFSSNIFRIITSDPGDWSSPTNKDLRGGANDSKSNNRGFDITGNTAINPINRKGPCDTGYHVPSQGEWGMLLKYWAANYKGVGNSLYLQGTAPLNYFNNSTGSIQFQTDFKIPFAGSRDNRSAEVSEVEHRADFWSSSPAPGIGGSPSIRFYLTLNDTSAYGRYAGHAKAHSLRCFKDSYLSFPSSVAVKVLDGESVIYSGSVETEQPLPADVFALMLAHANTKTGHSLSGWYDDEADSRWTANTIVETGFTVRAVWTVNSYSITFRDPSWENNGVVRIGEYGTGTSEKVDYPNWTRDGYTLSWSSEIPTSVPAHNTVITAIWTENQTTSDLGGSRGAQLKKDYCPGGDCSDSYYDGDCGTNKTEDDNKYSSANEVEYDTSKFNPKYSDEMNMAYQFAYHYGITTKSPIVNADMNGKLTRIAMAKMLSQYAIKVLGMKPDTARQKIFSDVSTSLDLKYDNGVTLAYQLGIMGINMPDSRFRPYDYVPRAEFVTALSRMLYKTLDGEYAGTPKYYTNHMNLLERLGILTNTDPNLVERRGYIMLMLMRSEK